ncbi:3-methyladenine DNA glycosylase/8-oxoguanine DNA glycosylase [Methanonatronarchaeum thermophilum]|uniref:DNA-(apurinic or apyrimidinic site) lyase n=1 Tax=Methanonatronarchaeum thermophilum TaxID=1927129 RepID=A0A1Y3GB59_9EURY|nr:DNA glycosylase [Methanonatronarchaeum thermophilum]OUJ18497.1 3-methyladenine DNA glycosylase/8-oxoguanine DNA glycosylase [Methanonatronarchaeum thermophilum]
MKTNKIKIKQPFDLSKTIYSGQPPNFVFNEKKGSYTGFIKYNQNYKPIKLHQKNDHITYKADVPKKTVKQFLGLHHDIEAIINKINTDEFIKNLTEKHSGLRITRFDPQFTVIAFIVSANNCIRNISNFISNLTKFHGHEKTIDGDKVYLPPLDNELYKLTTDDFKKLKAGYRSRYLSKTTSMLKDGVVDLNSLHDKNHHEVREQLMTLMGVGTKIADCISLFSYSNYNSFPVDVNIRRQMKNNYKLNDMTDKEIQEYARDKWGEYAGYAQQYIFLDAITR